MTTRETVASLGVPDATLADKPRLSVVSQILEYGDVFGIVFEYGDVFGIVFEYGDVLEGATQCRSTGKHEGHLTLLGDPSADDPLRIHVASRRWLLPCRRPFQSPGRRPDNPGWRP